MAPTIRPSILVRGYEHKTLVEWFDGDVSRLTIGSSLGEDAGQAAYDRWPVYEDGQRVGTLFSDGNGTTYDAVDNDGEPIF